MTRRLKVQSGRTVEFEQIDAALMRVSADGSRFELVAEVGDGNDPPAPYVVRTFALDEAVQAAQALTSLSAVVRERSERSRVYTVDDRGFLVEDGGAS